MSIVDLLLLVAVVSFAVSGYRQGFIVGILSLAGFVGGGIVGMLTVPRLLESWDPSTQQAVVAVVLVLAFATLGQALAAAAARRLRAFLVWRPARAVDAAAGALLSVTAVLLVAWLVASAVGQASVPTLSRLVRDSKILVAVDEMMPDNGSPLFGDFRDALDRNGFPQVFSGIAPEQITAVPPPDSGVSESAAVSQARPSIVKIVGVAESCRQRVEGSGFVYAHERVMTNAHVVAGVDEPEVIGQDGVPRPARVVLFDPARDVAVLHVPGFDARPLEFEDTASPRDDAVVAGYPLDGPFRAVPARIRSEIDARGPDIYDSGLVVREVYSVRAEVRPGNSGGPLLSPDGDVYGVVFAASRDDDETGYALTADEVASAADAGRDATATVDTQECT